MKTAFQLKSYIRFLWKSSNQHGVHSPFVFNLITKCFYNRKQKADYRILKSKIESIPDSDITVQNTNINTYRNAELLLRIVHYFKPESIVEIGNSYGFFKVVIQSENPKNKITASDTHFEKQLPKSPDLFYFNASETGLLNIFESLLLKIHNDSFFIFEGIHKTPLMEKLWETIKTNNKVTVTIDVYHFGLIFFRREQRKEHFTIRI